LGTGGGRARGKANEEGRGKTKAASGSNAAANPGTAAGIADAAARFRPRACRDQTQGGADDGTRTCARRSAPRAPAESRDRRGATANRGNTNNAGAAGKLKRPGTARRKAAAWPLFAFMACLTLRRHVAGAANANDELFTRLFHEIQHALEPIQPAVVRVRDLAHSNRRRQVEQQPEMAVVCLWPHGFQCAQDREIHREDPSEAREIG